MAAKNLNDVFNHMKDYKSLPAAYSGVSHQQVDRKKK